MRIARIVGLLCAIVALLIGRAATAQQSKEFTEAYNAGIDAYRLGKYAEARTQLGRAAKLEPTLPGPERFLAAVAQAEGKLEECLTRARHAIALNPQSTEVANTQKLHQQCRAALKRPGFVGSYGTGGAIAVIARAGDLETGTELYGASVALNGLKYGVTPLDPRAFAIGTVEVEVARTGYISRKVSAEVVSGVVTDVLLALEVDPSSVAAIPLVDEQPKEITIGWLVVRTAVASPQLSLDGVPALPDAQGRIEAAPGTRVLEIRADGYVPWRQRVRVARGQSLTVDATLTLTADKRAARRRGSYALGAAAVLGGVGAVFGVLELRARNEAQDIWDIETSRPRTFPLEETGMVEPVRTRDDLDDVIARGKRWRLISWAGYGAGALALAASVYFFLQERGEGDAPAVALAPLLPSGEADGGIGVAVTWSREIW